MKNIETRIDQSVKFLSENTNMKNSNEIKSDLIQRLSAEYADVEKRLVFLAVNEADALASQTFAPLLVLPTLAEEKVQQAAAWTAHQRSVLGCDSWAFAA
jgi:hypothetical protein